LARFGADLAICDRDAPNLASLAAEVEGLGRQVLRGELDVREADAVTAFAADIESRFERVHVLVNNAGGGFRSPFLDVSAKGQDALIRENFGSVLHFVNAIAPLMTDGGSIVNITSSEAHRAAPGYAIYAAQKWAVRGLTQSLALELGDRRIRVNCVAPDAIPTPGIGTFDPPPRTPLMVMADVDDCAATIVFLAGDMARFVTGMTVHVDGGIVAAGGWRRSSDGSWTA
jgi:NAD(P)-dependent dehydrogenase (short-subunit alcohol dehydrogenase family)